MVKAHTLKWKKKEAAELAELAKKHKVIAVARVERFPADLFQKIRKALSGKATIRASKTRVFARALKESGVNAEKLTPFLEGSIAIFFTDMDPFELYMAIKKNRGVTSAKAGMIAEKDIVVPKGDTGLPPGPDLADLKAGGLNPQMKGSSIIIPKDVIVAKAGEPIKEGVVKALAKLDIKPIEVGLNLTSALANGELFESSVLDIDLDETFNNFSDAHRKAFNLSVEIAFIIPQNASALIQKAFRESKAVSVDAGILNSATAVEVLGKANAQAQALKALVKEPAGEPKEKPKEEPKEEKKEAEQSEGKKEEPKGKEKEEKKEEPKEEKKEKPKEKKEKEKEEKK